MFFHFKSFSFDLKNILDDNVILRYQRQYVGLQALSLFKDAEH